MSTNHFAQVQKEVQFGTESSSKSLLSQGPRIGGRNFSKTPLVDFFSAWNIEGQQSHILTGKGRKKKENYLPTPNTRDQS